GHRAYLAHQVAHQPLTAGGIEHGFGIRALGQYRQRVERRIPNALLPAFGDDIVAALDLDAAGHKQVREFATARVHPLWERTHDQPAIGTVPDPPRGHPTAGDERHATEQRIVR